MQQDTVSADEEDDEVDADQHAGEGRSTVRHDTIIHHGVPVLSCQDLWRNNNWNKNLTCIKKISKKFHPCDSDVSHFISL